MTQKSARIQTDETAIALLQKDVQYIKETVSQIESNLEGDYVTHIEFNALKDTVNWHNRIFWFLMALILTTIIGALLSSILRHT